jgi:hypothetical protein
MLAYFVKNITEFGLQFSPKTFTLNFVFYSAEKADILTLIWQKYYLSDFREI